MKISLSINHIRISRCMRKLLYFFSQTKNLYWIIRTYITMNGITDTFVIYIEKWGNFSFTCSEFSHALSINELFATYNYIDVHDNNFIDFVCDGSFHSLDFWLNLWPYIVSLLRNKCQYNNNNELKLSGIIINSHLSMLSISLRLTSRAHVHAVLICILKNEWGVL